MNLYKPSSDSPATLPSLLTVTLIEDANHLYETEVEPSASFGFEENCTLSHGLVDCVIVGSSSGPLSTISQVIPLPQTDLLTLVTVPVSTAAPPGGTDVQPLATILAPSVDAASARFEASVVVFPALVLIVTFLQFKL